MTNLKFELIIAYYKRPKMVLNALESIKNLDYDNWHLTFVDDSGDSSFEPTLLNYGLDNNKVKYVPILMSDQEKINAGGSVFGKYVNEAISNSDCDVSILICDDDALFPDYLTNLNRFYNNNPGTMWGYCHVKFYDPETQHYSEASEIPNNPGFNTSTLNNHTTPIAPANRVDSSQVSIRKRAFEISNVWYPHPQTKNLDCSLFTKLVGHLGLCPFVGFYGQYKGWFANQLGVRSRRGHGDFIN